MVYSKIEQHEICSKCKGSRELDWVERMTGKTSNNTTVWLKPSVYIKEVDLSNYIPPSYGSEISKIFEELIDNKAEEISKTFGIPKELLEKDLKEDEVICPKCNGETSDLVYTFKCRKCAGTGKVTWVDELLGKNKKVPINDSSTWTTASHDHTSFTPLSSIDIIKDHTDKMASEWAKEIDKEILKKLKVESKEIKSKIDN